MQNYTFDSKADFVAYLQKMHDENHAAAMKDGQKRNKALSCSGAADVLAILIAVVNRSNIATTKTP